MDDERNKLWILGEINDEFQDYSNNTEIDKIKDMNRLFSYNYLDNK